jgi:hypothetical protein
VFRKRINIRTHTRTDTHRYTQQTPHRPNTTTTPHTSQTSWKHTVQHQCLHHRSESIANYHTFAWLPPQALETPGYSPPSINLNEKVLGAGFRTNEDTGSPVYLWRVRRQPVCQWSGYGLWQRWWTFLRRCSGRILFEVSPLLSGVCLCEVGCVCVGERCVCVCGWEEMCESECMLY